MFYIILYLIYRRRRSAEEVLCTVTLKHLEFVQIDWTISVFSILLYNSKVVKILKSSLDLITSPSVKIQIMSGKVRRCQQTFERQDQKGFCSMIASSKFTL